MPKWEQCKWEPCKWEPCKWERTRNGCATRSMQIQAETQQEMMSSLQACAVQHQCCNGLQHRTTGCNTAQRDATSNNGLQHGRVCSPCCRSAA